MQGRSFSTAALALSGSAVLVALVVLMIKVGGAPPEPDVDTAELERAASAGAVRPSGRAGAAPSPPPAPSSRVEPPSVRSSSEEAPPPIPPSAPPADQASGMTADPKASTEIAIEYYDRGEYESARTAAVDALRLGLEPQAVDKMLRIAASASCFMGEPDQARVHYDQLAPRSQRAIARRCRRMGIEF